MKAQTVSRQDADGLCTLTLNRPGKLNALGSDVFDALNEHIAALESAEHTIGCVVLRGAGRAFCAGADLGELGEAADSPPTHKALVIDRLAGLPMPVVAAVHGICFTGGLELALACDFIVADVTARFADTHGKWGLVSTWGMSQRLPRRVGVSAAKRMMLTGSEVSAADAKDMGLVDLLVQRGEFDAMLKNFTAELLANSWFTNAVTKRRMLDTEGLPLERALAREREHYAGRAPDYRDRIASFRRTRT
jgi:enoyl-CoA hydratase/carnithine racemase